MLVLLVASIHPTITASWARLAAVVTAVSEDVFSTHALGFAPKEQQSDLWDADESGGNQPGLSR